MRYIMMVGLFVLGINLVASALPENTCVVSGDIERQRLSAAEVEWDGSLNTCWQSVAEDFAGDKFRSSPAIGMIMIVR